MEVETSQFQSVKELMGTLFRKGRNKKEEKVQKNIKQINDFFIYHVILDWVDCETPFWECEEAILPEYADKYNEEAYVEVLAKKLFPMFNFDGLKKSIHSDFLVFDPYEMSVQISDGWGNDFYCSACAWFDADLAPGRWQNF